MKGVPQTNNRLERYNHHLKENFTFNLLMHLIEFLKKFIKWGEKESQHHFEDYATSPIKDIQYKTLARARTRIRHIYWLG